MCQYMRDNNDVGCIHLLVHAFILLLFISFFPPFLFTPSFFFFGMLIRRNKCPGKEPIAMDYIRSFSIWPNSLTPVPYRQHDLLWKLSVISSICVGSPPLCSHTPVLPYVITSTILNYNDPPTRLSSPQISLALDVAHHDYSTQFLSN